MHLKLTSRERGMRLVSGGLMVIVAEMPEPEAPLESLSKVLTLPIRKLRLSTGTQQAVPELSLSSC